jgi:aminoglycoside phosphotransferase (APT) family kinase protein
MLHAACPRGSPQRVVAHADLGAEHILELDGTLTGIIDWSDAAITDPALDLARLYGHVTGRCDYVTNAERSFAWLFPGGRPI